MTHLVEPSQHSPNPIILEALDDCSHGFFPMDLPLFRCDFLNLSLFGLDGNGFDDVGVDSRDGRRGMGLGNREGRLDMFVRVVNGFGRGGSGASDGRGRRQGGRFGTLNGVMLLSLLVLLLRGDDGWRCLRWVDGARWRWLLLGNDVDCERNDDFGSLYGGRSRISRIEKFRQSARGMGTTHEILGCNLVLS